MFLIVNIFQIIQPIEPRVDNFNMLKKLLVFFTSLWDRNQGKVGKETNTIERREDNNPQTKFITNKKFV